MIVLWASLAMVVEDLLGVLLVQAEARNRAKLAGLMDALSWIAAIAVTAWTVNTLNGHSTGLKVAMLIGVSVANYVGSYSGVKIGERLVKVKPIPVESRLDRIEGLLGLPPVISPPRRTGFTFRKKP
jgi:hypothetical protein